MMAEWISVKDRLPENETIVLVCIEVHTPDGNVRAKNVIRAMYTDGKHSEDDSDFYWNLEDHMGLDYAESGAYIIPCGWWEISHYFEEFGPVGDFVTHWQPLPEPPKEGE